VFDALEAEYRDRTGVLHAGERELGLLLTA
jgi:hypothetical protein